MISKFFSKAIRFSFLTKQKKYLVFMPSHVQAPSNSLNFKCKNGFFGVFSKEKKEKVEQIHDQTQDVLKSLRKEINEEKITREVSKIFRLFNEAQKESCANQIEVSQLVISQINQIEEIVEDKKNIWSEQITYSIKCSLLQFYASTKQHKKMKKLINEFLSEYFLQQILGQLDGQSQVKIILIMSEYLLNRNQSQVVIELCKQFLNQYEGERISSIEIQEMHNSIVLGYKIQNAHQQAFEEIENVIKIMNCQAFGRDLAKLHIENDIQSISKVFGHIGGLIYYSFLYQQYDKGQRLGYSLLQHVDPKYQVFSDYISLQITLLKNLNKHQTILLSLNKEISTQIADHKEKKQQIDHQIEEKFIHSLKRFLNLQNQFIDHAKGDFKKLQSSPFLQHLESFSPEGKQQLFAIKSKYTYLNI